MAKARLGAFLCTAILVGACHAGANLESKGAGTGSRFLFVWAGDADRRDSDFLAVIDADPRSASYASVVATLPVGATGTLPHHTEHELSATGELWANGFNSGQTFRFDLSNPTQPRLLGAVSDSTPVIAGHFWLQTNAPDHAIISLDVSDPSRPRETSRVTFARDEIPHWMSLEPNGERVVLTGYRQLESRVLLLTLDRATGALQVDTTFKTRGALLPGVDFAREQWPHGATGKAVPHGAVFSRH